MRFFAVVLVLSALCVGCGIPEAVGDECGLYRSAYETLSRKNDGLLRRGLTADAPIVRDTRAQLVEARARVISCTGQSS